MTCAECGSQADSLPYVGITAGDQPNVDICGDCQRDPAHRKTPKKVHYFARADFERGVGSHGVRQGPPPPAPYNSTRFEINVSFSPPENGLPPVRASVVEEAVLPVLQQVSSISGLETARAYHGKTRTRVQLVGELPQVLFSADELSALVAPVLSGSLRVDVDVWPTYR